MVRQEYKHLKADEKAIAKRFYESGLLPGRYEYDVHLSSPEIQFPAHWTKKDFEHWSALRDKRIDIVVHADNADWVLEVTPKLSKAAVGGCTVYRQLYMEQFKPGVPTNVGIVVEVDDKAYHTTCDRYGIKVWVV